jgi:hypothetical protein
MAPEERKGPEKREFGEKSEKGRIGEGERGRERGVGEIETAKRSGARGEIVGTKPPERTSQEGLQTGQAGASGVRGGPVQDFNCVECGQGFGTREDLDRHNEELHATGGPAM